MSALDRDGFDPIPPGHGEEGQSEMTVRYHLDHCARCGRPDSEKPVGYRCPCGKVKGQEEGE